MTPQNRFLIFTACLVLNFFSLLLLALGMDEFIPGVKNSLQGFSLVAIYVAMACAFAGLAFVTFGLRGIGRWAQVAVGLPAAALFAVTTLVVLNPF